MFTFRVITFTWAGFIIGVIAGTLTFNYFDLLGYGLPLFSAIIFSVIGGLAGVRF
jgi:hypothetical protein